MGTLHDNKYTLLSISRSFLLKMKNILDKICREKENTHFVSSNHFFFSKIMSFIHNVEKYCRPGQATHDTHGACALRAGYLRLQTHPHNM